MLDKHLTFLSYQSKVREDSQDKDKIIEACKEVIRILENEN